MESREITASSVDEAIAQAAADWGVEGSAVSAEVLEETKGLFGKPGKVRVKVSLNADGDAPKEEKAEKKPARSRKPKAEPVEEPEAEAAPAEEEEAVEEPKPKKRAAAKKKDKEEEPAANGDDEESSEPVVASQEDGEALVDYLNDILAESDLRAEATLASVNDRYVNIELDGRDVAYLIGRRGEVLNALQYLMNVISARQLGNGVRVTVDGSGYRDDRQTKLEKHAKEIAEQVREREEEAVLEALPAFERRLIHKVLVDFEGVITYSEGEEPNRRVVIAPKD